MHTELLLYFNQDVCNIVYKYIICYECTYCNYNTQNLKTIECDLCGYYFHKKCSRNKFNNLTCKTCRLKKKIFLFHFSNKGKTWNINMTTTTSDNTNETNMIAATTTTSNVSNPLLQDFSFADVRIGSKIGNFIPIFSGHSKPIFFKINGEGRIPFSTGVSTHIKKEEIITESDATTTPKQKQKLSVLIESEADIKSFNDAFFGLKDIALKLGITQKVMPMITKAKTNAYFFNADFLEDDLKNGSLEIYDKESNLIKENMKQVAGFKWTEITCEISGFFISKQDNTMVVCKRVRRLKIGDAVALCYAPHIANHNPNCDKKHITEILLRDFNKRQHCKIHKMYNGTTSASKPDVNNKRKKDDEKQGDKKVMKITTLKDNMPIYIKLNGKGFFPKFAVQLNQFDNTNITFSVQDPLEIQACESITQITKEDTLKNRDILFPDMKAKKDEVILDYVKEFISPKKPIPEEKGDGFYAQNLTIMLDIDKMTEDEDCSIQIKDANGNRIKKENLEESLKFKNWDEIVFQYICDYAQSKKVAYTLRLVGVKLGHSKDDFKPSE